MPQTPKQRMLNAYRGLPSDYVPVAPEFWYYLPARLLGMDMIQFEREVPHWEALQQTFKHYGTEGWGATFASVPAPDVHWKSDWVELGDGRYESRNSMETPFGTRADVIGGSAVYFSFAASLFTPVRLVGVVGDDVPQAMLDVFKGHPIDTAGLEVRKGSKTFRWHGSYVQDMNEAVTVGVQLNVLAEQGPRIPSQFRDSQFVFLANTHPALQQQMLASLPGVKLSVADTMNYWIANELPEVRKLLTKIDGLVLNDGEARLLTGQKNLVLAAREVLKMGPRFVVIKKGEHGSLMATKDQEFVLPAYPADKVVDPTGAGDSFAGGMMGYIASQDAFSVATLRRAIAYGTIVATFTISDFSLDGLKNVCRGEIDARLAAFQRAMIY
jgi:sugar/nucleoside kinase (ribokinase family)